MSNQIQFTKMHGIGNDFVLIDTFDPERASSLPKDLADFSRRVNDRRLGIGGDGLILVGPGDEAPFKMRMFNPDGSESEMCGNGIRCFGRLICDHNLFEGTSTDIETGAGTLSLEVVAPGRYRVDMGLARTKRGEIGMTGNPDEEFIEALLDHGFKGTAVSMGNPHLVIFVDDAAKIELDKIGPEFELHPAFPNRTNVHFIQVIDRAHLIQRTWERGAGITLACGTGACASAVAAYLTGRSDRKVEIALPGGKLEVEYLENGHVMMTGPAEPVFEGEITVG